MITYDTIGRTYGSTRREDPRLAAAIRSAIGRADSLVNVGAGAGSYEPADLRVVAVEPSQTMLAQRPPGAAPSILGAAESLPFPDGSFDVALAVNTIHHWSDPVAGLREMCRVARRRVVVFLRDPNQGEPFWLTRDYLPALDRSRRVAVLVEALTSNLPSPTVTPLRLPRDCMDGLFTAFWARPEMYLVPEVRHNISNFSQADPGDVVPGLERLARDLGTGAWDRALGHLRGLPELDLGHRIFTAELA